MTAPLTASLPEWLILDDGFTITLAAINPTTGAPVAGVNVSAGVVTGADVGEKPLPDEPPPLLTHIEV